MKLPKLLERLPLFMMFFVSIFGFIGLAMLIFLWSQSSDAFGSPPLIFKVFGSFIALAFMAMGFGLPITAILSRRKPDSLDDSASAPSSPSASAAGYRCPHCGAGLGDQEVSPSGDAKCTYCHKWWNIHRGGD